MELEAGISMQLCESCGLPLRIPEERSGGPHSLLCKRCGNKDGSRKDFKEIEENLTVFFKEERGLDAQRARALARQILA